MRRAAVALLILFALGCIGSGMHHQGGGRRARRARVEEPARPAEGVVRRTVEVKGEVRAYDLHVPEGLATDAEIPLVLVLHGGLGNAAAIRATTGMDALADREGFAVAYPEGTEGMARRMEGRRTWNAGTCCGPAVKRGVDDVAFLTALIDDVAATHPIDRRRVYVTGISNGAMMAYRLAVEAPERVAAVVAVSGTLAVSDARCAKDVPVLHIHGDADPNVPFEGGTGERSVSGVAHRSVPETIDLLLEARAPAAPQPVEDHPGVEHTVYECRTGAPVELLVIAGGGHSWPGGRGEGDAPLEATEEFWRFASRFRK